MLADGVQDEVRGAQSAGASPTARKALGFDDLLSGDIEQMKRRTRNYARRQLTWMRKLAGVTVIDRTDRAAQAVADEIFAAWRGAPGPAPGAQNVATNGYMSTTATTTPSAQTPISARSQIRPSRQPSAAA